MKLLKDRRERRKRFWPGRASDRADDILTDAIVGGVAGAAAAWAVGRTELLLELTQSGSEVKLPLTTGDAAGELLERQAQREREGDAARWAISIGAGAVYGVMRKRVPGAEWVKTLVFGSGVSVLIDEAGEAMFRVGGPGSRSPWQDRLKGAVGHMVFGLVLEAAITVTDRKVRE